MHLEPFVMHSALPQPLARSLQLVEVKEKRERKIYGRFAPLSVRPLDVSPPANMHNIADVMGVSEVLLYPYRYKRCNVKRKVGMLTRLARLEKISRYREFYFSGVTKHRTVCTGPKYSDILH